jgi:hypothetical protein
MFAAGQRYKQALGYLKASVWVGAQQMMLGVLCRCAAASHLLLVASASARLRLHVADAVVVAAAADTPPSLLAAGMVLA